jgi:hypothetical protein
MKKVKLTDLWAEVDAAILGERSAGIRYAIIEAHKILEQTLISQGYPGKSIEKKLYWAGYSLEDDGGIRSALEKRKEILESFDYQLSDLEAKEIVILYKKVVQEIVAKNKFDAKQKSRAFFRVFFSPKSIYFWRNIALFFSVLLFVKILNNTKPGGEITSFIVETANFFLSWVSVALIALFVMIYLGVSSYKANRTGIKIKE